MRTLSRSCQDFVSNSGFFLCVWAHSYWPDGQFTQWSWIISSNELRRVNQSNLGVFTRFSRMTGEWLQQSIIGSSFVYIKLQACLFALKCFPSFIKYWPILLTHPQTILPGRSRRTGTCVAWSFLSSVFLTFPGLVISVPGSMLGAGPWKSETGSLGIVGNGEENGIMVWKSPCSEMCLWEEEEASCPCL
jgi:hypothetical protein